MLACCIPDTVSGGGGIYSQVSDSKPMVWSLWRVPALPGMRDPRKGKCVSLTAVPGFACMEMHGSKLVFL